MTKAERERRAVAEHSCPLCHAQQRFSCRRTYGWQTEVRFMKHPHAGRVALVEEETR
jgi:hypothetical protein